MHDLFYKVYKPNCDYKLLNNAISAVKNNNAKHLEFIYRFAKEKNRLHDINNDRLIGIFAIRSSNADMLSILHSRGYDFGKNIVSDTDDVFSFIGEQTSLQSLEFLLSLGFTPPPSFFSKCAWNGLINMAECVIQKCPSTRDYFVIDFTMRFLNTTHMICTERYENCLKFILKNNLLKLETPKDISLLLHYYVHDYLIEKNTMIEDCLLLKYTSDAAFFSRDDMEPLSQDPLYRFYFSKTLRRHHIIVKVQRLFRKTRRNRAEKRMSIVKCELLAYTWHPDRFMEWCITEREKMNIKARFSY